MTHQIKEIWHNWNKSLIRKEWSGELKKRMTTPLPVNILKMFWQTALPPPNMLSGRFSHTWKEVTSKEHLVTPNHFYQTNFCRITLTFSSGEVRYSGTVEMKVKEKKLLEQSYSKILKTKLQRKFSEIWRNHSNWKKKQPVTSKLEEVMQLFQNSLNAFQLTHLTCTWTPPVTSTLQ